MKRWYLVFDDVAAKLGPKLQRDGKPLSFGMWFAAPDRETAERYAADAVATGSLGAWHIEEAGEWTDEPRRE